MILQGAIRLYNFVYSGVYGCIRERRVL